MQLFGLEIKRRKKDVRSLSGVDDRGAWQTIFDWFPGAFQADAEPIDRQGVLAFSAVYACITLIAGDVGKLRLKLVELDVESGVWQATSSSSFSPVLRKPNRFQTRQKFIEQWVLSKLTHGNAYILLERDARSVVTQMYVLDPTRVRTLVAPDGAVYYQLNQDDLSQVRQDIQAVPASEIIHDRMECLFHPLVGVSPIFACGLAATQGLRIGTNSSKFFGNMSRPGGILTAPARISDETAKRLKDHWEKNYKNGDIGKVAVLGDGLKYEAMSVTAVDADLVKQLQLSAEQVCSTFHVPGYKVGVGPLPTYNNIEALNQEYYSICLQKLIESIEALLDDALGLANGAGRTLGTEFDLDDLLRMDTATMTASLKEQVGAGITSPDEARRRLGLRPTQGGATPYLQQQNYSLAALAKRDAQADPFKTEPAAVPTQPTADEPKALARMLCKRFEELEVA